MNKQLPQTPEEEACPTCKRSYGPWSTKEVAAILGVSETTVQRQAHKNGIKIPKLGKNFQWYQEQVDALREVVLASPK